MLSVCLAQELGTQGFVVCVFHPGRLRTDSGSSDADTEPAEAAEHFAKRVDQIDSGMNGKCFDLIYSQINQILNRVGRFSRNI